MSRLTALGSGLLLGAGLGIIIPECAPSIHSVISALNRERNRGIETIAETSESEGTSGHAHFPTTTVAISLLFGFMFMLVTEQLLPGAHSHSGPHIPGSGLLSPKVSTVEFDADLELGDLEEDSARSPHPATPRSASTSAQRLTTPRTTTGDGFKVLISGKGFTLTLGLVLHSLTDGLALGSSIVSDTGSQELSLVIFAALIIHKGVTLMYAYRVIGFLLTQMVYSTYRACPDDLFVGKWSESGGLQKVPRNIQRLYTDRCRPRLPFPVVLPVCRWRPEPLDGNCDARFRKPSRHSFVIISELPLSQGGKLPLRCYCPPASFLRQHERILSRR